MAKYTVSCNDCGTDFTVSLFGRNKDREWKLANYTWTCECCQAEARAAAGAQAAADNAAQGLPQLSGSDKQVAWAERIRKDSVEGGYSVRRTVGRYLEYTGADPSTVGKEILPELERGWSEFLQTRTSASDWIDSRHDMQIAFNEFFIEWYQAQTSADAMPEAAAVKAESMLVPDCELTTQAIAEITVNGNHVEIDLPEKHEAFRQVVKGAGFRWSGSNWQRLGSPLAAECAAYVGQQALALGIRIIVLDSSVADVIRAGEAKACWIASDSTHAYLRWWSGDWYQTCKRLPGARWDRPCMKVDLKYYAEILDFAEAEGFGISDSTREKLNQRAAARLSEVVVSKPVDAEPTERPTLEPESFDVSPDLDDSWKNIETHSSLIQATTDMAVLIKLPKSKLTFWHPIRLVDTSGKNNYRLKIRYTADWIFKCFVSGKGRYNRKKKISEQALNVAEFEEYFHDLPPDVDKTETVPEMNNGVPVLNAGEAEINQSLDDEAAN